MPRDGDIIGLNPNGTIIQWDGDKGEAYSSGETPEEFGLDNMTSDELSLIGA